MSLPFDTSGPSTAPSVIFLHGGGVSGWMWHPVVERLSDRFHCIVPDLPGHGRSIGQRFSFADAVEALSDLIRSHANGGRAHLVGLSLGGQTLLHLLAHAPDLIERTIMSGTLAHSLPGFSVLRRLLRLTLPLSRYEWMIRANARQLGIPPAFLPQFRKDTVATTAEGLECVLAENMAFRLPANLKALSAPALVLVGDQEVRSVKRSVTELVRELPKAQAYSVPNAGHTWCLQNPELFANVTAAFLAGRALPGQLHPLS